MSRRILISGAGVAGPALAFWLHRRGCGVTLVERTTGLRSGGHAIDFRGTATRVLERMGLTDAVKQYATAFARYEATLRPMVDAAQKMAESSLAWLVPQTRVRLWASRRLWSWMPASMMPKLMIDQPHEIASRVPLDGGTGIPAVPGWAV